MAFIKDKRIDPKTKSRGFHFNESFFFVFKGIPMDIKRGLNKYQTYIPISI
jgi:hypothetical protein